MAPVSEADPHIGRVLGGQYRIDALLGQGGMGRVYRGMQLSVHRAVAIKLIVGSSPHPPAWVERFRREAEATAQLSHPNTVRLFDFGTTELQELYIVMELLTGTDLASYLRGQGPIALSPALRITRQVLLALSEAHGLGIIHRDIKPDNVFLAHTHSHGLAAKVMDFGIAGLTTGAEQRLTAAGVVLGTPAYMSPEQLSGAAMDARSDIYSLGVTLFEMLTCQHPFSSTTPLSLMAAQLTQTSRRLTDAGVRLGHEAEVQAFLDRLMAKEARERPTTDEALEAVAKLTAIVSTPRQSNRPPTERGSSQIVEGLGFGGRRFPVLVTGGVLALAAAATYLTLGSQPKSKPVSEALRSVTVMSNPTGATVLLDGVTIGSTPLAFQFRHAARLTLMYRGYELRTIRLTRDSQPLLATTLVPERGVHGDAPSPAPATAFNSAKQPAVAGTVHPVLKGALRELLLYVPERERREQLVRLPVPYPNVRSARGAYEAGQLDQLSFQEAVWMLRERSRQQLEAEDDKLARGDTTSAEYEARLVRIDAVFWGD
jgi:serine/threonine protein kinase